MEKVASPADIQAIIGIQTEDDKKEQDRLLKVYQSRARLTPSERRVARGIELERVHATSGNLDALAEALAMQGRFGEAAITAVNQSLKDSFQEKALAVSVPDDDCTCDTFVDAGGYGQIPTQYVESNNFSIKHGKTMPFIRCTVCGDLNARALPQHLADQHAIRSDPNATDAQRLAFFKT